VIGRFILPLVLAAALPASAQQFDFTADRVESNASGSIATGHARYAQSDLILTADQLTLSADRSTVTALGHVVAARAGQRLLADELVYQLATRAFTATRIRFGAYPYYVEGESASGTPRRSRFPARP
jgi:LPS-assembly protein